MLADCEVGGMTMMQHQPQSTAPVYTDEVSRIVGVMQHLQCLLAENATLTDVSNLVGNMQQEFGSQERLETVIQALVGRHLAAQVACRLVQEQEVGRHAS